MTMISRGDQTPDDDFAGLPSLPIYDHCPKWCTESGYERTPDDDHCGDIHESGTYAPAGQHRVYACLQQADLHGKPRDTSWPDAEIRLSNGQDGEGRIELIVPVIAARSLARILTHLADVEEL